MQNLAELLIDRARRSPDLVIGMVGRGRRLHDLISEAGVLAGAFGGAGIRPGDRVVVLGSNSWAYLVNWVALQLAGAEAALTNPAYPPGLLASMLDGLAPRAVIRIGAAPVPDPFPPGALLVECAEDATEFIIEGSHVPLAGTVVLEELPGLARRPGDLAGFMHTSGTTGAPKFCAQSHRYFLELGRLMADRLALGHRDIVFAPLPLFHINPLGYGLVPALLAGAGVLSAPRFSASGFWPDVVGAGATALILHGPPIEILKKATSSEDAVGHAVRICFFADADFLATFDIPTALSAYGSTEAGGVTHLKTWRRGDPVTDAEGMSRVGGTARPEVEWRVDDGGQLEVRATRPNVLFDGYATPAGLRDPFGADGWFSTGDRVRVNEYRELVFVERLSESIRVGGEYVPIPFVERHFAEAITADLAIWKEPGSLGDDAVVLYVVGPEIDKDVIVALSGGLPSYMRPVRAVRISALPLDPGVGKVRRVALPSEPVLEHLLLDP